MKLHQSLKLGFQLIISTTLCCFASVTYAENNSEQIESKQTQLVEVELSENNLGPYKERRSTHGLYFGLDYEQLILVNYVSTLNDEDYTTMFGQSYIPLVRLNLDYKYNTPFGALAFGIDLAKGSITGNVGTGPSNDRTLDVTKYGLGFKFVLDMLFDEPYVAPYFGFNIWQMTLSEKSPTDSFSATTQMGYNYTLGLMLQLDWLDFDQARTSTFNWGLENTFLDIYATQYAATTDQQDPDTATDILYGAGIRFEF
ncbi:MAG: hypothetical protein ACXVCP_00985 [Bdellovibrio sp.]